MGNQQVKGLWYEKGEPGVAGDAGYITPGEEEFFLPELPRMLPVAYHPKAAQIEMASNAWVCQLLSGCFAGEEDLLRFLRQRNGLYGPLTVPTASEERARNIADWYQFVTVIDSFVSDRSELGASHSRAREVFARVMAQFRGDAETSDQFPYGRAAKDMWLRISSGLTPAQVPRFTGSLEAFLRGCAAEIRSKLNGEIPDYETCMAIRTDSFGCAFLELLTEYSLGVDLTDLTGSPELAEVHGHGMRQLILVNDLLSWRKEHEQQDTMTTIRVLREREGMALQSAVDRLCELVEHHEKAYIAARDEVLDGRLGEREDVRAYLRGLDYLIGGSQEFEYLTPRYFGDGFVWDGATSGWLSLTAPVARLRQAPGHQAGPGHGTVSDAEQARCPRVPEDTRAPKPAAPRAYTVGLAPGALPLLGHALPLRRRPLELLRAAPAHGDLVELRLGPRRAYLACHPDLAMQVLLESRTFDKGGPLFEKVRLLVGNGLFSSDWKSHRKQRRMVQPSFHAARMPGYATLICEEIERELASWQPGRVLDVSEAMHTLTMRITTRSMFSNLFGERAAAEVLRSLPVITRGVYKRMVAPLGWAEKLPTPDNRRFQQVRVRMRNMIEEIVREHRRRGRDEGDLLSALLQARDEATGEPLTDEEIHDQVMTLLIGGTETTGSTLSWACYFVAEHPEVEEQLHREVDQVLAGRAPGHDDLSKLDYIRRVLTETLRLCPPAWLLSRTTTSEVELAGRRLRPGTIVFFSPYVLGHNPALYDDPERFDPDRWLPERASAVPRGAMLAFGAGSRKCIGDSFGMAEATLALAALASRWRLLPVPGMKLQTEPKAALGTGPLPMVPQRRPVEAPPGAPAPP
ncbi:MAG TPA: cytochrome P450 [Micromonosporaceae bacterium]|nr:cytochrome P450 [Micromonosporaceae bacterium]